MSRHFMPITHEIKSKIYQLVMGYDRPLGTFYFQVWDSPDADSPINDSLDEFVDIVDLVESVNYFLGNLIGKTYEYPFSEKFFVQLLQEQEGGVDTNTCGPWKD